MPAGLVALSHTNTGQVGQNGTSGTTPSVNQPLNPPTWDNLGQDGTKKRNFCRFSVPPETLQELSVKIVKYAFYMTRDCQTLRSYQSIQIIITPFSWPLRRQILIEKNAPLFSTPEVRRLVNFATRCSTKISAQQDKPRHQYREKIISVITFYLQSAIFKTIGHCHSLPHGQRLFSISIFKIHMEF